MRRNEFIETLKENLERNGVRDTGDIIEEYEEHFAFKLADGYSEEEIAAKLDDPKAIAAQYAPSPAESKKKNKALVAIGIGVLDLFFGIFCILITCFLRRNVTFFSYWLFAPFPIFLFQLPQIVQRRFQLSLS